MTRARFVLVAAFFALVIATSASIASAGTSTSASTTATAGAGTAACLAHVVGGVDEDWYDYYTTGCSGHDEPELDPVSSAPGSAQNISWHVQLPADGTFPVTSVGPTFWFGGTVKDTNPNKIGGEGFLELQFYPDSVASKCSSNGGFSVSQQTNVYTACSPVWTLQQQGKQIIEPAAFNGMLTNTAGTGAFVMHARDIVDVHIWAPTPTSAYQEQVTDETSGQTSNVLVLNSQKDGPLTPAFSTNEIGNALDWGGVWDTPMAFVWEIGHADLYTANAQFCLPGQTICGSFNNDNWAGFTPIRIFDATFGDGSHQQNWAVVSDTGGKAEILGNSFVGPTDCTGYGGPYCIYPWYSWDGAAINYGVTYPNTVDNFGKVNQFAQTTKCPANLSGPTYCDKIVK